LAVHPPSLLTLRVKSYNWLCSATKEININKIKEKLANFVLKEATPSSSDLLIMNLRQKEALKETRKSIARALDVIDKGYSRNWWPLT